MNHVIRTVKLATKLNSISGRLLSMLPDISARVEYHRVEPSDLLKVHSALNSGLSKSVHKLHEHCIKSK